MFSQRNNPYCDLLKIRCKYTTFFYLDKDYSNIFRIFATKYYETSIRKDLTMKDKNILGLDLGTNSIGWAIIKESTDNESESSQKNILDIGSRIIPMDAALQGDFAKGNTVSSTKDRTQYRGVRRLRERQLLRRERLHRVLSIMGFLPPHYANALTRYGKFKPETEVRLPWDNSIKGNSQFLFIDSYNEMLQLFWQHQPELMQNNMKVPYDWTIYYLRQKALHEAITGQELAWILLNFNQKRGYYQTRGEETKEDKTKEEKYYALKVVDVVDTGEKRGKDTWYNILLENGMTYRRTANEKPDWIGKVKEFIVTTSLDADGNPKRDKDGNVKQSFRMPKPEDWGLQKIKTEYDIHQSGLTIGEYIFKTLLTNPKQKIIGGLVRVVERDMYKDELRQILKKQKEFLPQLNDSKLYADCITELYPQNKTFRQSIANRDFTYLLLDNIIFYQRPLKSKKSLIDECPYEYHEYKDENGNTIKKHIKCIAKSHPLYQEFRLWQFIGNLKIYTTQKDQDGREIENVDVTTDFLPDEESYANLFDYLNDLTNIKQDELLVKYFNVKKPKGKGALLPYHWNYVQDKQYPCNTTRGEIISRLEKANIDTSFLNDKEAEQHLWHILYSVSDKNELYHALCSFATHHHLDQNFAEAMAKFPPFDTNYGAYSAKAIKRLLPLMRMGHHWHVNDIDQQTIERINHIIDGEYDENISDRAREKASNLTSIEQYRALPLWMACYVVYSRHSESSDSMKWRSPADIDIYLHAFRQHSLRNPIVEQVITETLRTVRDIWEKHQHIDEIHIEMGRELKNPADKRRKDMERMLNNENANLRIKALLTEFLNPELGIENVRPYSPSQQELLRIYEDTALNSVDELEDDISDILKKFSDAKNHPTTNEIKRYKLWLEQHYLSPYTGQPIPLTRLFTSDYEIEHVIPQSRYFDDSMTNKVICESEVNKLKDNALSFEFIKQHHGETVQLSSGKPAVQILEVDSYCNLVEQTYRNNHTKKRKLLMDDIPAEFIERQLNDSRYISKLVKSLLSNIVREDGEQEAISKNVIVCTGSVTDRLKKDWGVNDVWNHIILPRFLRMNEITDSQKFTTTSCNGHIIPNMPLELQKGFNKKRIDHRHHAMDAIVIACATRDHVNLLSNEAASPKSNANRHQLSHKLRRYEDIVVNRCDGQKRISVAKEFMMPWNGFTSDVEQALRNIIVTFKQNLRVINKTSNHYQRIIDGKKRITAQTSGDSWAIRKSMHKETVFGEINLQRIKTCNLKEALQKPHRIVNGDLRDKIENLILHGYDEKNIKKYFNTYRDSWRDIDLKKIEIYYFTKETSERFFATRKSIDTSFTKDAINAKIADTGIQKIMLRHLERYNNKADLAFSPDGIDEMNRNITELNDGHFHQPIYKVRVYEKADKFAVGQTGNKNRKFVEAAKGTNLFFAIHEEEAFDKATGEITKKRTFQTIPLNVAMEKMKQGLPIDEEATFILSPNDLVYLPTEAERKTEKIAMPIDRNRIYKMVDSSKSMANFVPHSVANIILSVSKDDSKQYNNIQNELGCGSPKSKNERAITGEMIKDICIPIKVDRLGNITKIGV